MRGSAHKYKFNISVAISGILCHNTHAVRFYVRGFMKYENPICEILYLKSSDVIATSNGFEGGDTSDESVEGNITVGG